LATHRRTTPRADIRLKHVHVSFEKEFEVQNTATGTSTVAVYSKFTCTPESGHLHRYFVELMAATAAARDGVLAQSEADEVVGALLELFRKLSLPATRSVSGVWGELLLIHLASNPGAFVDAWHSTTTDSLDFSFSEIRVEVKATERTVREHEFSLRQVRSGVTGDYVASVVLSRSSAGRSALELTRLIADRVDARQQAKLWMLVLETLGDDAEGADDQLFDIKSAADSLVFVPSANVPAPSLAADAEPFVSDVRFKANITTLCTTYRGVARSEILSHC
jgi:hypothetical protein